MTPHDLFRLEKKLLDLGAQIVGIHSLAVEGNTANVIYDISPDPDGSGLNFSFEFPPSITREELCRFSAWLATVGHGMTRH